MIEEQHVTQYGSLIDPLESWFQQHVFHEYLECYLYWSFMEQETDLRVKALWELHLGQEIEHLRIAAEMLRTYEGIEAAEILPAHLPPPTQFQSMKGYVRSVLAAQVDLTAVGTGFVDRRQLPTDSRYHAYQAVVHAGGMVPSEEVIARRIGLRGTDYRLETEGANPVSRLQQAAPVQVGASHAQKDGGQ